MKTLLLTEDDLVLGSNLTLDAGETLIVIAALKLFVEDSEHHQIDKDAAQEMVEQLCTMFGIEEEE